MCFNKIPATIGFWPATSIIIGSIIGSGIFMKPATMALQLQSPLWLTAVWIIAGLFSLIGALIFAELGSMLPHTGGMYVYYRYMYGDLLAFLYGWAAFAVINTAAVAAISFVCAYYANYFLQLPGLPAEMETSVVWHIPFLGELYPLQNLAIKLLAIAFIIMLTVLNYVSVRASSALQVISTLVKVAAIGLLIAGIFSSGNGSFENFITAENPKKGSALISGIIMAMSGAFFAFDGWINVTFVAGEIKQPQKNIPKSLFIGVFVCIAVYVLINQAFLYVMPVEKVAASSLVASDALTIALGTFVGAIIAALIVICTFGAINGNAMSVARVTYAMGKDKVFFPWVGREHPKFRTPANALVLHCTWCTLLVITGSFDMLADIMVFIGWLTYLLAAIGIFILRRTMPDHPRPYKVWGYPWVPVLFIAFSTFYLMSTVWSDIYNYANGKVPLINSLFSLALVALGIPFYLYFRSRRVEIND